MRIVGKRAFTLSWGIVLLGVGCGGDRSVEQASSQEEQKDPEHLGSVSQAVVTPTNGLVGLWHLDGNTTDASGHGHNGVIVGAPAIISSGRFGKAYRFDGASAIDVGDLSFATGAYTVNTWYRTSEPAQQDDWRMMVSKLDSATGGPFELNLNDGRLQYGGSAPGGHVWDGGIGVVNTADWYLPIRSGRDGAWHMATMTHRSGSQKLYNDGVLIDDTAVPCNCDDGTTRPFVGALPVNAAGVRIGGSEFGFHHPWIGDLDEVAIYNRVLTATEVALLYGPLPKSCLAILQGNADAKDGVYTIQPDVAQPSFQVRCDMTKDGGGWTQVGNYPFLDDGIAGVAGWSSGSQVGTSFTDRTKAFKMSDAAINALKTTANGFRAHGTASTCLVNTAFTGPCAIDTTVFFKSACNYSSSSLQAGCGNAYRDDAFRAPIAGVNDASRCAWHYGLAAASCTIAAPIAMVTSFDVDLVATGGYASGQWATNGRDAENPAIDIWVK